MNSILLKLQKNTFYALIPITLLLSYSIAYVARSLIILFIPEQAVVTHVSKDDRLNTQSTANKPVTSYEETVTGNLIRGSLPNVGGTPCPPDKPNCKPEDIAPMQVDPPEIEETVLTGCISGSSWFARATFKDKSKDEAEEFGIGQKFFSYKVFAIGQTYAVLARDGRKLKIDIGESIKDAKARQVEPITEGNQPTKIGDGKCQTIQKMISRTEFERYLNDQTIIYKGVRQSVYMDQNTNKMAGIKIHEIQSNHVFYSLGARMGDVLRQVNGIALDDTKKMLELWANIKNSNKVTVDIERKGACITYEFTVRN